MNPSATYYNNNVDALVHTGPCELIGVIVTDLDGSTVNIHDCVASPDASNRVMQVYTTSTNQTVSIMLTAPVTLQNGIYVDVGTAVGASYTIIYR